MSAKRTPETLPLWTCCAEASRAPTSAPPARGPDSPEPALGSGTSSAALPGGFRPPLVVVENVASGERRWLPFVRADLEALGYVVDAHKISAADVGAPHRRARIFLVAYRDGQRVQARPAGFPGEERAGRAEPRRGGGDGLADATGEGLEGRGLRGSASERGLHVADTDGERVRLDEQRMPARRAGGVRDGGDAVASHDGDDVAHTDARGLSRVRGRGQLDGRERAACGHHVDRRGGPGRAPPLGRAAAQPSLGGSVDGVPNRLDGRADRTVLPVRWPAGPGAYQHDWEPPRAIWRNSVADHEAALAALGNAVSPQQSREVGRVIVGLPSVLRECGGPAAAARRKAAVNVSVGSA